MMDITPNKPPAPEAGWFKVSRADLEKIRFNIRGERVPSAFAVYVAVADILNRRRSVSEEIPVAAIALLAGTCYNTAESRIADLEAAGIFSVERVMGVGERQRLPNRYTIPSLAAALPSPNNGEPPFPPVGEPSPSNGEPFPKASPAALPRVIQKKGRSKEVCMGDKPPTPQKFHKPTLEDVKAYCRERGNSVEAERFIDHYAANGWRVGKNPMREWKAAVRTWERTERKATSRQTEPEVKPWG